jgi:phenylpropionate dioxygenase-like ring-hydroxylating dioxygenase large terminal subunit
MTETIAQRTLNVPYELTRRDRVSAPRYFDEEFFAMEKASLWPRVWQMACRLEDIPKPGNYVEYEIFEQSIVVVRVDADTIKAYENTCRHRGVKLAQGNGHLPSGFTCPFHGWCWSLDGTNTFVFQPELFDPAQLDADDLRLREVRAEITGGFVFINMDKDAPPLRESIGRFAEVCDAWQTEDLRVEWWLSCALPTNWKLAMEAFMEGYHVRQTHPQLMASFGIRPNDESPIYRDLSPTRKEASGAAYANFDSRAFIEAQLHYMKSLSYGMAGLTHEKDLRIAQELSDLDLSADPANAGAEWTKHVNHAVMDWHREQGENMPDLNAILEMGDTASPVQFCYPNYFILVNYSSASAYRVRPLTEETCLFELWSLTRYPPGQEPDPAPTPVPMLPDDPSWPEIPAQDFSNLPRQQSALRNPGFEFMRLSDKVEGMISNYHRVIDGYIAGLGYDELTPAVQVASGAFDAPIRDVGF